MKRFTGWVGLIAVCCGAATTCHGQVIYDNLSETTSGQDPVAGSGPLYDSFSTGVGTGFVLSDLKLLLNANAGPTARGGETGSTTIGLYSTLSSTGTSPGALITTLGTVSDASLGGSPAVWDVPSGFRALAANTRYWIGLSTSNGSLAEWSFAGGDGGTGVSGEYFVFNQQVNPNSSGPYQMSVTVSAATPMALIWNTTSGTWNTTATTWTTGTGGVFTFLDGDSVTFNDAAGGTVTISGTLQPASIAVSAASGTYTFVSSAGNLLTGTAGLSKSGGGTLVLSGSNGFTGATSVTGGTLLVNGVLSSTTTTVSALLGGSGTVSGAVQMAAGGTVAPGAAVGSTGILSMNSLSGTSFALAMEIAGTAPGTGYDRIVTTTLDYSGATLQLSLTGSYADGTTFDLFDFTTRSGTLAGVAPLTASLTAYNGLTWGLATTSTNFFDQKYGPGVWLSSWGSNGQRFIFNQADGVLTVVPEPSTFVMAGLGIAGYALLRRRRAGRALDTQPAARQG